MNTKEKRWRQTNIYILARNKEENVLTFDVISKPLKNVLKSRVFCGFLFTDGYNRKPHLASTC